jgi:hypothetical protein
MNYSSIGFKMNHGPGARDCGPWLWSVHHELMPALMVHLTEPHAPRCYVASNLTTKASGGRPSRWEPHHSVGWRWGGQNLAGDEEEWRQVGVAQWWSAMELEKVS